MTQREAVGRVLNALEACGEVEMDGVALTELDLLDALASSGLHLAEGGGEASAAYFKVLKGASA